MAVVGIDLGTAHLGVVVVGDALPLHVLRAVTPPVAGDLDVTAQSVRALADDWGARDIVCEMGALYIPRGASPQKARAMAANHATMDRLLFLIYQACPGPWYRVTTIARRTWSSRILPHHDGGITDAEASAALAAHLDPGGAWPLLSDQHRRDAAGAIVGHILGPPQRQRAPGSRPCASRATPRTLARRAQDAALDALLDAAAARVARPAPLPPPTLAAQQAAVALLPPVGYSGRR